MGFCKVIASCAWGRKNTYVGRTKRDWMPLKEVLGSPVTEGSDSCSGGDGGGGEGGGGEGGGGEGGGDGDCPHCKDGGDSKTWTG